MGSRSRTGRTAEITMGERKRIALGRACVTLKRSYNQTQRLVMVGALRGGQDESGKWWVDAADLERFQREESARGPQAA